MEDTGALTREALGAACMAASSALVDARDFLAQAVGYTVLLDDDEAKAELSAVLCQSQAMVSIVSAHLPPAEAEEA